MGQFCTQVYKYLKQNTVHDVQFVGEPEHVAHYQEHGVHYRFDIMGLLSGQDDTQPPESKQYPDEHKLHVRKDWQVRQFYVQGRQVELYVQQSLVGHALRQVLFNRYLPLIQDLHSVGLAVLQVTQGEIHNVHVPLY